MKKLVLIAIALSLAVNAEATLPVIDYSSIAHNIVAQAQNFAKYVQEVTNQETQITNQVTQITNQLTQLSRLGNPSYYVNMLGLGQFSASISQLSSGVGQTIQQYRSMANGQSALGYTGNGLYSNLNGTLDRFGNPVLYNTQDFAKFNTVQTMTEALSQQQTNFNTQNTSLLGQLNFALQKVNSETTQIGTEKLAALNGGIQTQVLANQANAQLAGQRLQAQQIANQNDAARMAEAQRQQIIQERQTDLANEAQQLGNFVGGASSTSPGGILP